MMNVAFTSVLVVKVEVYTWRTDAVSTRQTIFSSLAQQWFFRRIPLFSLAIFQFCFFDISHRKQPSVRCREYLIYQVITSFQFPANISWIFDISHKGNNCKQLEKKVDNVTNQLPAHIGHFKCDPFFPTILFHTGNLYRKQTIIGKNIFSLYMLPTGNIYRKQSSAAETSLYHFPANTPPLQGSPSSKFYLTSASVP